MSTRTSCRVNLQGHLLAAQLIQSALVLDGVEYYTAEQINRAFAQGWWVRHTDRSFDPSVVCINGDVRMQL